ncbi:DUF2623 domain-containing protein, partial [Klebsiella pneumoniae]
PSTGKGEDLTPGAYLPFGCQSRGRHGAHAAAHWEAGILTRRYGLDRDMVMDFFKEGGSGMAMRYFLAGYRLES